MKLERSDLIEDVILFFIWHTMSSDGKGHITKQRLVSLICILDFHFLKFHKARFAPLIWVFDEHIPNCTELEYVLKSMIERQSISRESVSSLYVCKKAPYFDDALMVFMLENIRRAWAGPSYADDVVDYLKLLRFKAGKGHLRSLVLDNGFFDSKFFINDLPEIESRGPEDLLALSKPSQNRKPKKGHVLYSEPMRCVVLFLGYVFEEKDSCYVIPLSCDKDYSFDPLHYPVNATSNSSFSERYYVLVRDFKIVGVDSLKFFEGKKGLFSKRLYSLVDIEMDAIEQRIRYWYGDLWYKHFEEYCIKGRLDRKFARVAMSMLYERVSLGANVYIDDELDLSRLPYEEMPSVILSGILSLQKMDKLKLSGAIRSNVNNLLRNYPE